DEMRVFQGGAILPGMQLMFQSLHDYTAKLPLIHEWDLDRPYDEYDARPPGKNTENAIVCGVIGAACGGVDNLILKIGERCQSPPMVFITGGMGRSVHYHLGSRRSWTYREKLTLEGIRIAAESLP
ncbi:MAG TPA: type III pantothenate kinase, partial [Gemmataceae bacterium]